MNRILYVRNLPYKITTEEIYDIFGKFGALRQVRLGINPDTKGTAYVVYEVIFFYFYDVIITLFLGYSRRKERVRPLVWFQRV